MTKLTKNEDSSTFDPGCWTNVSRAPFQGELNPFIPGLWNSKYL